MALKRIRYVGPQRPGVVIEHPPGRWVDVPFEGTVDLPTRLAESFAEQVGVWEIVDTRQAAAKAKDSSGQADPAGVEGEG